MTQLAVIEAQSNIIQLQEKLILELVEELAQHTAAVLIGTTWSPHGRAV